MKIKDLGIIDITWIDAQINFLKHNRDKMGDYKKLEIDFKIEYLESLKTHLIPAKKLVYKAVGAVGLRDGWIERGYKIADFFDKEIEL